MTVLVLLLVLGVPATAGAAGALVAAVADGELSVTGDDAGNAVAVTPGGAPDTFLLTGLEGTTVNGAPTAACAGVARVRMVLGPGADRVELLSVDVAGRLLVKLGGDRDTLLVDASTIRGRARIVGGAGPDDVVLRAGSRFGGRLVVTTGRNADRITVNNVSIGRDVRLDSGAGRDGVLVQFSIVDPGADTLVSTGRGEDDLVLFATDFRDDVQVFLGDDDDDMLVEDCDFDEAFRADGGEDDDEIDFDGVNVFSSEDPFQLRGFEGIF